MGDVVKNAVVAACQEELSCSCSANELSTEGQPQLLKEAVCEVHALVLVGKTAELSPILTGCSGPIAKS